MIIYNTIILCVAISSVSSFSFWPFQEKIVGGSEATPHQYPWMVQVKRLGAHFCGGSLLNNEWIVTAGQCFSGLEADYEIVAGDHNIRTLDPGQQNRNVRRAIVHPAYYPGSFENDIVLMQVSPPFLLNDYVQPISLAIGNDTEEMELMTVMGWGSLISGGATTDLLHHVSIPFVDDRTCEAVYPHDFIAETMLCAGSNGKDSCRGDAGGPLVAFDWALNRTALWGVVAWGFGCGEPGYPGVYTEIPYFAEWMIEEMSQFEREDNSTFVVQDSGCGGVLSGSSGQVAYNIYFDESNRVCTWTLKASNKTNVRVELYELVGSLGDIFTISELDHATGRVGNTSRITIPGMYTFKGPTIFVTFISQTEDFAFRLHFYGTDGTDPGVIGHDFANYFLGNETDLFYYPTRGGLYRPNEFITIFINAPESRTLNIESLDTQLNADVLNIHVFDNGQYNFFSNVSGNTAPAPIRRDGPYLLTFVANDSIEGSGFLLSWRE